jgi:hypothetical protein
MSPRAVAFSSHTATNLATLRENASKRNEALLKVRASALSHEHQPLIYNTFPKPVLGNRVLQGLVVAEAANKLPLAKLTGITRILLTLKT